MILEPMMAIGEEQLEQLATSHGIMLQLLFTQTSAGKYVEMDSTYIGMNVMTQTTIQEMGVTPTVKLNLDGLVSTGQETGMIGVGIGITIQLLSIHIL